MKIVLNYDYSAYPFTTASYLEMAAKKTPGVECYRRGQIDAEKANLIINVMPFEFLLTAPGVPSVYWEIDNHLIRGWKVQYYNRVDRVYVAQKHFLDLYPPRRTYYLPLGCWPDVHHYFKPERELYDIGFIGNGTYPFRRTLLEQLDLTYKLLWANTPPGVPYSKALSACTMTFNRSMNHDVNMRFFECLAIGRLLFTDRLAEQKDFAQENVHYIGYKDWPDLREKIAYYLQHPNEREAIAAAGAKHVRENHTYGHRLRQILEAFGWRPPGS